MSRRHRFAWPVLLMLVAMAAACSDRGETPSGSGASGAVPGPPLPAACQLVTAPDVQSAIGAPVSEDAASRPDRCRYVSDRSENVEITVDRPGFSSAVRSYRGLYPEAQAVEGIGDEAAVRVDNRTGELIAVKGTARLFVVVTGGSPNRDALLAIGRIAARRL